MTNLLTETLQEIEYAGQTTEAITYIGSRTGYACTWSDFVILADQDYHDGFGAAYVASDLEIHFRDGSWLERTEYDGSEGWKHRQGFTIPTDTKPIRQLVAGPEDTGWPTMSDLNKDDQP